jgi:hypothetical protein
MEINSILSKYFMPACSRSYSADAVTGKAMHYSFTFTEPELMAIHVALLKQAVSDCASLGLSPSELQDLTEYLRPSRPDLHYAQIDDDLLMGTRPSDR